MNDFHVIYDDGSIAKERREERLRELYFSYKQQLRDLESRMDYLKNALSEIKDELGDRWWMD